MRFSQPRELARNLLCVNWDYNNFFFTQLADDCTSHATPRLHWDGLMLGVSLGGLFLTCKGKQKSDLENGIQGRKLRFKNFFRILL